MLKSVFNIPRKDFHYRNLIVLLLLLGAIPLTVFAQTNTNLKQHLEDIDSAIINNDYTVAAGKLEKIIAHWQGEPTDRRLIVARIKLVFTYQQLGFIDKSLKLLEKNLDELKHNPDDTLAIQILSQASDVMLSIGELGSAEQYIQQALQIVQADVEPIILATLFQRAGNSSTAMGYYEEAINYYNQSIQYSKKVSNQNLALKSEVNRLFPTLQHYQNNPTKGINALSNTLKNIELFNQDNDKSNAYITLGVLALEQLQTSSSKVDQQLMKISYNSLNSALTLSKNNSQYRHISVSAGYLSKLYANQQRFDEALSLLDIAVFYAEQIDIPEYLYQWYELKGDIYRSQGDKEAALNAYQKSVQVLSPIRNYLDRGVRSPIRTFDEAVKSVYYALADLLLQQAEKAGTDEQRQALLLQARDTIESLKVAELENYFQDDCVATLQASQKSLENVSQGIMVLYPISLPDRLVLLVSGANGVKQYSLPVKADVLKKQTLAFRKNLQSRPHNRFLIQAERLYDWMIAPLHKDLDNWQVDTMIIVADGLLRTIPFATLYDGKQFLIEKYALATAPGFKLIDPKPLKWQDNKVLLAGLSEAVQNFSPLPNVPKELQQIESVLLGKQLVGDKIVNQQYTLEEMKQRLENRSYSVVHMATHAQFTGQHSNDFLLTYDKKLTIDKLKKLIGFGRFRDKPIELLTMSACQTALGDERAALGLAGVAVKAGARSALATLWFVDDEATSLAVTDFYKRLAGSEGPSKAKALQGVQKQMLRHPRYWHPSYWAPFLLIGNWL